MRHQRHQQLWALGVPRWRRAQHTFHRMVMDVEDLLRESKSNIITMAHISVCTMSQWKNTWLLSQQDLKIEGIWRGPVPVRKGVETMGSRRQLRVGCFVDECLQCHYPRAADDPGSDSSSSSTPEALASPVALLGWDPSWSSKISI